MPPKPPGSPRRLVVASERPSAAAPAFIASRWRFFIFLVHIGKSGGDVRNVHGLFHSQIFY
jgi:hypothetical protein